MPAAGTMYRAAAALALQTLFFPQESKSGVVKLDSIHMQQVKDTVTVRDTIPAGTVRWASYSRTTLDGSLPPPVTRIRTPEFLTTLSLYAGAIVGLHLYQAQAWWRDDRGPFHFQEDWPVDLQVDKFGHFFGAYLLSYASREALLESGFTDGDAHAWGAVMGLAYQLYVEVEDGFSTQWGFSPTDAYADIAGASYFYAQRFVPILQNFHEKWTYWPSPFLGSGSIPGQRRTIFDDYQGQSYWWTVDLWNLLPDRYKNVYPKWLQLAVGYAVMNDSRTPTDIPTTREVFIGFDYNLNHLIPKTNLPAVNWFIQTLDNLHFPAPAFQLAPERRFYILYPIRFHIGGSTF